jgi:putative heme iron utilization protein
MSHGTEARRHLASCRSGVLSTLSLRHAGHPFGSLVPYVLDHEGRPVVLVSRLAEHTKNIEADARVSLLAHDAAADPQAGARVTLLGGAAPVDAGSGAAARYRRFFPDSEQLVALGDFSFLAITPLAVRFIKGFGGIHWISAQEYAPPANSLAQSETDIVAHMNADHAHNLRDYCRHVHGKTPADAALVGLDCDGFDIRARFEGRAELLRFDFEGVVTDAGQAREALVALARASRHA